VTWRVERARGSAAAFHARSMPDPPERTVWVFAVDRPAIVLGSRQSPDEVRAPDGVEVVRRHSGGGAVWLEPASALWVDVVVPRDDPLWDDDVGRAAHWLGAVWARAAGEGAVVHRGPLQRTRWSGAVCFAGLGPGEVTVGGRKVVGISQRRTRAAARFQCVAYERWDPAPLLGALGLPADAVVPGGTAGPIVALEAAFLAEMP
jgi:lipoate-protein ligase A